MAAVTKGAWKDGHYDGVGIATYASGDRYEGDWRGGQRDGHGRMTFASGERYDGSWKDNRPEGRGEAWIEGKHYIGNWVSGCYRNGPDNRRRRPPPLGLRVKLSRCC